MQKENVLVTGASGEVGYGLIVKLAEKKKYKIVALDKDKLDDELKPHIDEFVLGSVLNKGLLAAIIKNHNINLIFHLAAILSTAAERSPELAHRVNVEGTLNSLEFANKKSFEQKRAIKFIFPSTIAVYGLPDIKTKLKAGPLSEEQYNTPTTIYGANKLYCELLGQYYSNYYRRLTSKPNSSKLDFRCLRFPGIISATTQPTGGTSDYAPEMIHTVAKGESYETFVRPDTKIPFIVMPDAVRALITIAEAPKENLKRSVYNVSGFTASAQDIENLVTKVFPETAVSYNPDKARQAIVDSWPATIDNSHAQADWGWSPDYDIEKAFKDYLIPEITSFPP